MDPKTPPPAASASDSDTTPERDTPAGAAATAATAAAARSPGAPPSPQSDMFEGADDVPAEEQVLRISSLPRSVMHSILSHLSTLQLLYTERVSRTWHDLVRETRRDHVQTLDLGQFWAFLGGQSTEHDLNERFVTLLSHYKTATHLDVSYCHRLGDDLLERLLDAGPPSLVSFNLFFCLSLTDRMLTLLCERYPNLVDINIGRCNFTFQGIRQLAGLQSLQCLRMQNTEHMCDESIAQLFTAGPEEGLFPALTELDLLHCKVQSAVIEDMQSMWPRVTLRFDHRVVDVATSSSTNTDS